jgi:hypothetical protein
VGRGCILAVEAVELSHAWEIVVDGELPGLGVVGQLHQLVVDGIVGLEGGTCRGAQSYARGGAS